MWASAPTRFSKIETHLRICRKFPGECAGALCLSWQSIRQCSCAATTIIGRFVTIQAARNTMRRGDWRVLAAMYNFGAHRCTEAGCTPYRTKMQTSASVCILERTSSGMDEACRLRRDEEYGACEDEACQKKLVGVDAHIDPSDRQAVLPGGCAPARGRLHP